MHEFRVLPALGARAVRTGRMFPVWLLLLLLSLGACTSARSDLRIEFYDSASMGLSLGDNDLLVPAAGFGFSGESLLLIEEADIVVWEPYRGNGFFSGSDRIELQRGPKTEDLAALAVGRRLVFRLSFDSHSFWGSVAHDVTEPCLGPCLTYMGWLFQSDQNVLYLSPYPVWVEGVSLAEAAREAWSD